MRKNKTNIVYKEQLMILLLSILEIAGHEIEHSNNFENQYKKWLKFQKVTDWKKYRASIDLLVDTEYALMSAFEYQLGYKKSKHKDIGETYLRLYGILNAVYLQMGAFQSIANLLNYPGRQMVEVNFKKLNIYKLRNIAGSHTVDYEYPERDRKGDLRIKDKMTSFRIVQMYLEKTGRNIVALDENDITLRFNLLETLREYDKHTTDLLVNLIKHMTSKIVKAKSDKESISAQLNELLPELLDYSTVDRNK